MDSVGEGEGGEIWENSIETCIISCMKKKNKSENLLKKKGIYTYKYFFILKTQLINKIFLRMFL